MALVFIVDDEPHIRDSVRMLLEDAGHSVQVAVDGVAALALLRASCEGGVVLLDVLMPRLDGIGVLREVARDPELATRYAYILMTTEGADLLRSLQPTLAALAITSVAKPFDIDDVLLAIDEISARLSPLRERA